jgi:hypothetical protein
MRLRTLLFLTATCFFSSEPSRAAAQLLSNGMVTARFGPAGLESIRAAAFESQERSLTDAWKMRVDGTELSSTGATPTRSSSQEEVIYRYEVQGYSVQVRYQLRPGWAFIAKEISVVHAPKPEYTVQSITPLLLTFLDDISDLRIPTTYTPASGETIAQTQASLPGRDFGLFLRWRGASKEGLMLLAQNPYLHVEHGTHAASLEYKPEIVWQQAWGPFRSDLACIGSYRLQGASLPQQMILEWKLGKGKPEADGLDRGEIQAYTDCVRAFLIDPQAEPTRVEVGWTLNDYQIDVATDAGRAEYKRIIDATSGLGIGTLLYAPTNTDLAKRKDDTDAWHWEHTLWLNLGQKIRKGEWDPVSSPIPPVVSQMLDYARSKNVRLLAYVYPSVPFQQDPSWLVKGTSDSDRGQTFASMSSRKLQDLLIRDLIAFKRRTGIAGYSFDYAFLNFAGSSSYAQWAGWRRVMEELRKAEPDIIIDGRQSYQQYGPWSWLAGSYPHPTGGDEQPESFLPYPDLHFDRVSADRTRFVNYWYRNYQFAPTEIVPGYATHQTERSRNIPGDEVTGGHPQRVEEVHTAYRQRDWDYLGYRYSFLSSIGTAGWNNIVDMIPARDEAEYRTFSAEDKAWIRAWLDWTKTHQELLRHTRSILNQPRIGAIDGTAAIDGNSGFLFLFNPNYEALSDELVLDGSIGLTGGKTFLLREVYPNRGRLWGRKDAGVWRVGDHVPLRLDGTSATVLELLPAEANAMEAQVYGAASLDGKQPEATVSGSTLAVINAAGEPGHKQTIGVLLPRPATIRNVTVNGKKLPFQQNGGFVSVAVTFSGNRFDRAQAVDLHAKADGSVTGTFTVPRRIVDQLKARAKAWPIPWKAEDYETTWLVPSRLLLFLQAAEAKDTMEVEATLDGKALAFTRAYTSTRVHPKAFVGLYADLSAIQPDHGHTLTLRLSGMNGATLQGVFFDNVEPELTTAIAEQP